MKEEKDTVNKMNVLVCTPGRLLQHMDETPMFDCVTLRRVLYTGSHTTPFAW